MSCILTIAGVNFDIDEFLYLSGLVPNKVRRKGEPRFRTKPDGPKIEQSFVTFLVSEAGFMELTEQISDAITFLEKNQEALSRLKLFEINHAFLDFGTSTKIDNTTVLYETFTFPVPLLKLAGNLELELHLSVYSDQMEAVLESRRHTSKN
ncbi:hypothetical protein [Chitinophaga sp. Cy-1792]|uniref:hypothetical protein n=1 Tax=Chitinophaga sp. Cy-1792 TaxID=2608339 RepID=UPI0014227B80|nr:hypothetical protein [Chitinophaga sp. Cy-1792]NIG56492.1 hypothetical protein [Chitinophaga sp. Cy-1792]